MEKILKNSINNEKNNEQSHIINNDYKRTVLKNSVNFINVKWDRVFVPDMKFWEDVETQEEVSKFYKLFD